MCKERRFTDRKREFIGRKEDSSIEKRNLSVEKVNYPLLDPTRDNRERNTGKLSVELARKLLPHPCSSLAENYCRMYADRNYCRMCADRKLLPHACKERTAEGKTEW